MAMSRVIGHGEPRQRFQRALTSGNLHHAWIFAGLRGLGKASLARELATALLSNGDDGHTAAMVAARSHPDFRWLERLPKEEPKPGETVADDQRKRSITVEQIRSLQSFLANRPSIAKRRVIIIDAIDDLERSAANALLKNLEEPPPDTIFIAISHAPSRLLPTLRSRCQLLRFEALSDEEMREALTLADPELRDVELQTLVDLGEGRPGYALEYAGLDLTDIEHKVRQLMAEGDPDGQISSELARSLALKNANDRYEAFLRRTPSLIAEAAGKRDVADIPRAVDAWARASELASRAMGLSLSKANIVLEMTALLASLSTHKDGAKSA